MFNKKLLAVAVVATCFSSLVSAAQVNVVDKMGGSTTRNWGTEAAKAADINTQVLRNQKEQQAAVYHSQQYVNIGTQNTTNNNAYHGAVTSGSQVAIGQHNQSYIDVDGEGNEVKLDQWGDNSGDTTAEGVIAGGAGATHGSSVNDSPTSIRREETQNGDRNTEYKSESTSETHIENHHYAESQDSDDDNS